MRKRKIKSSNWKKFWKMEKGRLNSLSYLALRCAMMNLVECLIRLQKVFLEKYGIEETLNSLYFRNSEKIIEENYEKIKELLQGKEIQALIDYHVSYREIISRTDLLKV